MAIPTSSPSRIGEQLLSANKKLWSRYAEEDARSHSLRAVLYRLSRLPLNHKTGISMSAMREAIESSNSVSLGDFLSAIHEAMGVKSEIVSHVDEIEFHRVQNCIAREEVVRELVSPSPVPDISTGASFSPRDATISYRDVRRVLYMPTSIEDHHEKKHYEVVPSVFDGYKEVRIRDKETFRREYECTSTPSSPTDTTGRLADALAVTSAVMKATAATTSAFDIKVFADAMYGSKYDSTMDAAVYMTKAMRPTAFEEGVSDVSPHTDDSPDRPNDKPTLMNDAFGYWS